MDRSASNTVQNRGSVTYNILNGEENVYGGSKKVTTFDSKVSFKQKGITEFADLTRTYNHNLNKEYPSLDKKKVFGTYNGVFTYMYDSSHRNGGLSVPFQDKVIDSKKHGHSHINNGSRKNSPRRVNSPRSPRNRDNDKGTMSNFNSRSPSKKNSYNSLLLSGSKDSNSKPKFVREKLKKNCYKEEVIKLWKMGIVLSSG